MQQNKYSSAIRLDADLLFTVLPHEILCAIFSHLSWGDLVLCMSVHPTWASRIPHYAKNKLSTFEFTADLLKLAHHPLISLDSLGPHVETVIMHQLIDRDCVIKALEILVEKKCNVKKLKLCECRIFDLERFLQLLNQVGRQTLTELTFELHRDQMPYRHIIAACPNLAHFACDLEDVTYEPAIIQRQTSIRSTMALETINTNITYLSVNILLQRDDRLYPLLRMCPQLRCLVLGYGFFVRDGDPHRWRRPIDLGTILDMCPRLAYFQCNSWENNPAWMMHAKRSSSSSSSSQLLFNSEKEQHQQQQGGLREFITDHCGIYDSNQIMPLLLRHSNTLEVIKLNHIRKDNHGQQQFQRHSTTSGPSSSWLHELEEEDDGRQQQVLVVANSSNFDRLHTLVLKSIQSGEPYQVAAFIRRCPNLQEISLDGRMVSAPVLDALATTCPHLRRLELKGNAETKEDGSIVMHAFRNFLQHGSMTLQSIRLAKLKAITDDLLLALVGLQELELTDLPNISEYGMQQFIASASSQQQQQRKFSRRSSGGRGYHHRPATITHGAGLRTLVVKDMHVITENCLRALSRHTSLHTLQLCRCGTLSEAGLMELTVDRNKSNVKRNNLKELYIDCCTVSINACVAIRKRFGQSSIRSASKYWPE